MPRADGAGGVALLREAYELGVRLFDSAWAYGPETADQILGEALGDTDAVFATKGGVTKERASDGSMRILTDGSRETLLAQIEGARRNLRRGRIELFQLHRVDPEVAIERSVEALAEARDRGWIGHIGLSNVTREDLDRARAVAPIASVQNRFNMAETAQNDLVDYTAAEGIAFLPYGPLGAAPMQQWAKLSPRDALAWLLRRSPNIIVIAGTTSIAHLRENWLAWDDVAHAEVAA
ncbi:MAG: aldo/keto reductase [Pseudomonadota bacterium]